MRELIHRFNHPREERGVSAIFFGLAITVLIAGLGLSIDIGNVAYQRNRAQNAVDNAARDLARACAQHPTGAECTDLQNTAAAIAAKSFDGGTVVATTPAAGQVKVAIDKNINTPLLSAIGITEKAVAAEAVATSIAGHPKAGFPVLPLGVGYCTWKNNSGSAGTSIEASHKIALRTDTLQSVQNLLSPLTGGLLSLLTLDGLLNSLVGTDASESCTDGDNHQLLTFQGAVWLTGDHVVTGTLSGLFGWNINLCRLNVGGDLSTFLGGAGGAAFIPPGCTQKFGPGKEVMVGKTLLLPVYKPHSALQDKYGLKLLSVCGALLSGKNQTCIEVPPKIGVQIIGFAPFKVTGWTYPNTPTGYTDSSVGCSTKTLSLNLHGVINGLLTVVERLLNSVVLGLLQLLGLGGNMTASLSCNGLQGYFTKTFTKDPNFQYSSGAADLGANYVKLTQ